MTIPTAQSDSLRQDTGAESRLRLLSAAEAAFADQGFHGASLNAIARAARLSNPGLIHHFPNKAALYLALLDSIAAELTRSLDAALAGVLGPKARLQALIAAQARWTIDRPLAVKLVLRELADNVGRVEVATALPLSAFVQTLTREFAAAQQHMAIDAPPLALVTQMLGTLSYGLVVRPTFSRMWPGDPSLSDDEQWVQTVTRTFSLSLFRDEKCSET